MASLMVVVLAACGSSPSVGPLVPAAELAIVAKADDDLVLLGPELEDAVTRGTGITTVYVTAGSGERAKRTEGAKAAYGAMAGSDEWVCGERTSGQTTMEHCRLEAAGVSLVFLDYPDGGADGGEAESLLHLWQGDIDSATSAYGSKLTQGELIRVLAEVIDATAPTTLRTLEIAATHGRDQSDHMLVGALALLGVAAATATPVVIAYRGDNIADEAANVDGAVVDRATMIAGRYAACTTGCAACGAACAATALSAEERAVLARRYPVAMRAASGLLRQGASCVTVSTEGANAALGDCLTAPSWALDEGFRLRSSTGLCLRALATGEMIATGCANDGPGGRFFFDEEGHLWSGIPALATADMAFAHVDCVVVAGGRPRAALCGAARAPTWELAP